MTADPPRDDEGRQRLVRADPDRGDSLAERISARWHNWRQRSFIHKLKLRGVYPLKLIAAPPDLWPGDAERGEVLLTGQFTHGGHTIDIGGGPFDALLAPDAWLDWFHSFHWLRDLAAIDPKRAQPVAEAIIQRWIAAFDDVVPRVWRADLTGERLRMWIGHAPMILSSTDQVYRSSVLNALARGSRHLAQTAARMKPGIARMQAASGLIVSGLMLPGGEDRAARGGHILAQDLDGFILPDGGFATRNPADMMAVMRLLLSVRQAYQERRLEAPPALGLSIDRLGPALLAMRMGDGLLAQFNGGDGGGKAEVDDTLAKAELKAKPLRNGAHCGFQRIDHGKTVVVIDAGPPPPGRIQHHAHAGALSFEFSDGLARVVINCGGGFGATALHALDLAQALRATAAHSTLIISDTNSTQIRADSVLGKGINEVTVRRDETEDGTLVDGAHDGYVARFGFIHRRRLFVSRDGMELRGEDSLAPMRASGFTRGKSAEQPFDIRFHLGRGVEPTFTQDGQGAIIRLASGQAWMFKLKGASLSFGDSIWLDPAGHVHKTRQLIASGVTPSDGGVVKWMFNRSGKH